MNVRSLLLSLPAFFAALGLGVALRQHSDASLDHGLSPARPMEGMRSSREKEQGSLLAQVRLLLRAGNVDGAIDALSEAAERDPKSFLRALRELPYFSGLEDAVKVATARLIWRDPEVAVLLNGVGPAAWRGLAWQDFVQAQTGKAGDGELFQFTAKALVTQEWTPVMPLLQDAARNRPLDFAALLDRIDPDGDRGDFYRALMQAHPEILADMQRAMKPGSLGARYNSLTILEARVGGSRTAEDLAGALADAGPLGSYGGQTVMGLFSNAYRQAAAGEQARMLDLIAAQPPVARNKLMEELTSDVSFDGIPAERLNEILGMLTSGEVQGEVLKEWMNAGQNLDTATRNWVSQLPTEKLRVQACAELNQSGLAK